jgi:hypothetical protein
VLADTFFPPPPLSSTIPEDYDYPTLATPFKPFTEEQINCTISNTSSYKASGPNRICNIVFKCAISTLTPYLLYLFNTIFTLRTYFDPWREFTTVVLRKPGKADYSIPKAYCPIALINTTCKLLTNLVVEQVTHIIEHFNLLPSMHFGGHRRRGI